MASNDAEVMVGAGINCKCATGATSVVPFPALTPDTEEEEDDDDERRGGSDSDEGLVEIVEVVVGALGIRARKDVLAAVLATLPVALVTLAATLATTAAAEAVVEVEVVGAAWLRATDRIGTTGERGADDDDDDDGVGGGVEETWEGDETGVEDDMDEAEKEVRCRADVGGGGGGGAEASSSRDRMSVTWKKYFHVALSMILQVVFSGSLDLPADVVLLPGGVKFSLVLTKT